MMAEGYKPTAGMQAAARRAIKFKEDGKAKGAGTAVGWTRAHQLVNGESLSLDTVKRMFSFFSRHEVDKKGKNWGNQSDPSNGYIMWLAWGGDAGFSWSRKIVNREKNMKKSEMLDGVVEEIKSILSDVMNPVTEEIVIEDDQEITKVDGQTNLEVENEMGTYDYETPKVDKTKDKYDQVIKPRKGDPADKNLYNRIIAEAKRKFDTYPSAYANGWVVQEYKRRGGTYKASGSENLFNNLDPYEMIKRNFSSKQREEMAQSGQAMPDSSFPIANKNDLMNAIRSWGRSGADPKVKEHIKRRAKSLGLTNMIPENWK